LSKLRLSRFLNSSTTLIFSAPVPLHAYLYTSHNDPLLTLDADAVVSGY
jgi:hypothetical protein